MKTPLEQLIEAVKGERVFGAPLDDIIRHVSDEVTAHTFLDACGICNGAGAIYDCGCSDIPEGDCDCNGGQGDALGDCDGDCQSDSNGNGICDLEEEAGCTYAAAINYLSTATMDDGSCLWAPASCAVDVNMDGLVGVSDILLVLSAFGSQCP